MKITVEIPDLLYRNLDAHCKANNLTVDGFVYDAVSDKLYVEIYGDINPKQESDVKQESQEESEQPEKVIGIPVTVKTKLPAESKTGVPEPEKQKPVTKLRRRKLEVK